MVTADKGAAADKTEVAGHRRKTVQVSGVSTVIFVVVIIFHFTHVIIIIWSGRCPASFT